MPSAEEQLAGHPDRQRWNARYAAGSVPSFEPHPLAVRALELGLPPGPVVDLACGPSGSALLAAQAGRRVTAVDVSELALSMLRAEARRRGLADLITLVHADLGGWRPAAAYALVLCTGYWDRALFAVAAGAVRPGGILAWEAFTSAALAERPGLCAAWCLGAGEPAGLLPSGFQVLAEEEVRGRSAKRRLLARRGNPRGPG
jgi:SAM-dependent methyltransferase